MRSWFISLCLCTSVALAAHHLGRDATDGGDNNGGMVPADKNFLQRQLQILRLMRNIHEQNHDQEQQQIGNNFNIDQEASNFSNSQAVKAMQQQIAQGKTSRNQVFDIMSNHQRQEAITLFDLFFFAKDFDTFYRAACWARDRVNAGQFIYALHVAVMHRPDTQGMVLPPIYEVHPQLFVDSMAMQKLYNARMQGQDNFQVQANYSNCPTHCQFNNCENTPNSPNCQNCQNCDLINGNGNNNNNNNDDNNNGNNNNGNSGSNFNSNNNPNNQVSYFNEDPGMNAFNYYFHVQYPFWMDQKKYGINKARQGELFLHQNQQLLARYNLERYSNNLDAIQPLQVQQNGAVCIQEGHNPSISFENGNNMPNRPDNFCIDQNNNNNNNQNGQNNNNNNFNNGENDNNNCGNTQNGNSCGHNGMNANQKIQQYQRRIYDAIDHGFAYSQDGNKISLNEQQNGADNLGRLVQANSDFVNNNYYGNNGLFNEVQKMVGRATDPFNRHSAAPAAVSQYETALRDSAYFSLLSNIHNIQQYYKSKQPAYTNQDLGMNGVAIQNVDVDKMMTYFDNFFMDANNAIKQGNNDNNNNNNNINYQVKQQRLNHKPFSYNINVQSNQASDAIVRVFIGPKTNPNLNNNNNNNNQNNNNNNNNHQQGMPLEQARPFFVEIDRFKVNLKEGQNKISRNAKSSPNNVNDQQTFEKLFQKTQQAIEGSSQFLIGQVDQHHCGWPKRMQIPRGKTSGQEFTMFFIVNPTENKNNNNNNNQVDNYLTCSNKKVFDNRPLGFPFDRPINTAEWNNNVSNAFFKNVVVYHKNGNQQ
uniref:Hexamerin-like protein n=1 Tax=Bemisia tabaci TaxID=7038 RepID=A0A7S5HGL7_BEMTA|nr:hexamerin-like protein [Bemisia tabaci]